MTKEAKNHRKKYKYWEVSILGFMCLRMAEQQ
jgi:hypothetical protein